VLKTIDPDDAFAPRNTLVSYAAAGLAVLLAAVAFYATYGTPVFPLDDAYITLHNALVLTSGTDLNFPGTPALAGSTSVIHTVLVALLSLLIRPTWAMATLSWLAILLYVFGLLRLAQQFRLPAMLQAVFIIYGVSIGRMPHHLLNGLETGLAMAAVVWAIALGTESAPRRLTMLVCGLLPFIRPELAVISVGMWAVQGIRRRRLGDGWLRSFAIDSAVAMAAALPWVILLWINTGTPLVNTIAAKRAFYAETAYPWDARLRTTGIGVAVFAYAVGWGIVLLAMLMGDSVGWVGLAFVMALLASMFYSLPHATVFYEGRYMYLIVPWILYGGVQLWKRSHGRMRFAVLALMAVLTLDNFLYTPQYWRHYLNASNFTRNQLDGIAQLCKANVPANARIMVHDIGYISFATRFQLIDAVGLKSPVAVTLHERFTVPTGGDNRKQAIHELALATHPDYLVVLNDWDDSYDITKGLRENGWHLDRVQPLLDRRRAAYSLYRMEMPPRPVATRSLYRERRFWNIRPA
jgi:hypothetical protein